MPHGVSIFVLLLVSIPGQGWASVAPATALPPATVVVQSVAPIDLSDDLTYPARVTPKINTVILAETDGVVSKIQAPLGQSVKPGARILTITHTDPIYQFAPFKVTAPVAGIVSSLDVTEGSQVTKGQRLAAVTDPQHIRFNVEIPASDLAAISRGLKGTFRIASTGQETSIIVRGVSPFVDPATGTASAELEPVSGKSAIAPGVIGQVNFRANLHKGISIPEYALYYIGDDTFVRVLVAGKVKQIKVKVGSRSRGNLEILDGLKGGMTLIERTSRYVVDGEAVTTSTGS